MTAMRDMVDDINGEINRLGAGSIQASEQDGLPTGWVMVSDGHGIAYGPGAWILEDLSKTDPDDEADDDGIPSGWHSAWAALAGYPDTTRDDELDPASRTATVVSLARQLIATREAGIYPILADALQDAGESGVFLLEQLRRVGAGGMGVNLWVAGWLASEVRS